MSVYNTKNFSENVNYYCEEPTTEPSANKVVSSTARLSWTEKLYRFVYGSMGFSSAYHLFDIGLANLLALDILKHGTGLKNYFSISLTGADPTRGGTSETQYNRWDEKTDWGRSVNLAEFSKNKFFVMHETDRSNETDSGAQGPCMGVLLPMGYTHSANSNSTGGRTPLTILLDFITPVLRFKFTPADFKANFTPDKTMPKGCFYTEKSISPLHLGVTGSLIQGINPGIFSRMVQHPSRVLRGIVFLGAAAYVGKRTYRHVTSQPQPETSSLCPKEVPNPLKEATSSTKAGLPDEEKNLVAAPTSPAVVSSRADLDKQRDKKPSIGMRIRNVVTNGLFFRVIGHQFIAFM